MADVSDELLFCERYSCMQQPAGGALVPRTIVALPLLNLSRTMRSVNVVRGYAPANHKSTGLRCLTTSPRGLRCLWHSSDLQRHAG